MVQNSQLSLNTTTDTPVTPTTASACPAPEIVAEPSSPDLSAAAEPHPPASRTQTPAQPPHPRRTPDSDTPRRIRTRSPPTTPPQPKNHRTHPGQTLENNHSQPTPPPRREPDERPFAAVSRPSGRDNAPKARVSTARTRDKKGREPAAPGPPQSGHVPPQPSCREFPEVRQLLARHDRRQQEVPRAFHAGGHLVDGVRADGDDVHARGDFLE